MDSLCSVCRSMFDGMSKAMSSEYERPQTSITYLIAAKLYYHHNCIEDLIFESQQGCRLCHYIWSQFSTSDREMIQAGKPDVSESGYHLERNLEKKSSLNTPRILYTGGSGGTACTIWSSKWCPQFDELFYFIFSNPSKSENIVKKVVFSSKTANNIPPYDY
jgi:hypothetical protein